MLARLVPEMGIGKALAILAGTVVKKVTAGCDPGESDVMGTAVTPGGKLARLIALAPTGRVEMRGYDPSLLPGECWREFPVVGLVGEARACLGRRERRPGADEC
jgi:hypothetical protein